MCGGSTCGRIWRLHHRELTQREKKEDQGQQLRNNLTNGGRKYDLSKKLRTHQHLWTHVLPGNILRVAKHKVGRGPYLCRSQVMLMTTYKFLRWVHSTRRMDEGVVTSVTSEKCWSGIKEKMPEISREVNHMKWWRIGDVSTLSRGNWKSDQKVVMDEKSNQNGVMGEKIVKNLVMDCGKNRLDDYVIPRCMMSTQQWSRPETNVCWKLHADTR